MNLKHYVIHLMKGALWIIAKNLQALTSLLYHALQTSDIFLS